MAEGPELKVIPPLNSQMELKGSSDDRRSDVVAEPAIPARVGRPPEGLRRPTIIPLVVSE
jgi:hypothetical protein